jgi:NAD(P)-dependent dehydrogenase (short-subunit alcohol dehydrogenase family)
VPERDDRQERKQTLIMTTTSLQGTPIDGAVALVTGGDRGFGRALVDELLRRGATKIHATSRSPQPRRDERIVPIVLDVTDEASATAAAQAAHDVSIIVNHAGIALGTPVLEAPIDRIREELETNLFGTIRVTRAFAPVLATQSRSALVNVLSVLSWLSMGTGYDVSKAAAWSATNSIRVRLRDQRTTVTALHVAYMNTETTAGIKAPKAGPSDIASAADAIASGALRGPGRRDDKDDQLKALRGSQRTLRGMRCQTINRETRTQTGYTTILRRGRRRLQD